MNRDKSINEVLIELGRKDDLLLKQFSKKNKCKKFCDLILELKNKLIFWRNK